MAQITYQDKVALNQEASIPDINKVTDSNMNEIKSVVNINETKLLLAVASSAPVQCSTGDMYFNTTTNLIYTATGTNTWGITGTTPTSTTIYVVLSTNSLYAYNGSTLITVGGKQPENSYSTSQENSYTCHYTNKSFGGTILWTNTDPTSTFGGQEITLSETIDNFDMFAVIFRLTASNPRFVHSGQIPIGITRTNAGIAGVLTWRDVSDISGTSLTFGTGNQPGTQNGDWLVPLYVIGYKTGLFS